jgi:hypothetical protein
VIRETAVETAGSAPPKKEPVGERASLGVGLRAGHYRVIALEAIAAGSDLLELHGLFVDVPSRYSVQVAEGLHVAPPEGLRPEDVPDRYLWRFLNHGCEPNAAFVGRRLVALRDIAAWEELSFDYETTEYEIAEPFRCRCGKCEGREVRGFRHLDPAERQRRAPWLAEHLRSRLALDPVV